MPEAQDLNQEQPAAADAGESRTPLVNPREAAMAAVEARHNAALAAELELPPELVAGTPTPAAADPNADPDADPDDAVAAETRAALAREAAAADQVSRQMAEPAVPGVAPNTPATPAAKVIDNPDEYMVRVKVDGQEELRSLTELVRTGQKEAAATRRLNEAAALRAEAERLAAEARAAAAGRVPATDNANAAPQDALQLAKEFTTALYGGEQETAEAVMARMIQAMGRPQAATPNLDPAAIAAEVEQRIATNSALEKFAADFPEIVRDPYLARVADDQLNAALAEGKPFAVAVQEAGHATRDWARSVSGVAPAGAVPTAPSRDERLNRKQQLDRLPVAAATATASNEPHIPTPQEILAEMRRARGLG